MGAYNSKININVKFGWKRELPDINDKFHTFDKDTTDEFKSDIIDLRANCPPVYNQGDLGSCTANAVAAAFEYKEVTKDDYIKPSRLFIYYNERVLENTVLYDSGATIRDSIKTLHKTGVCSETDWPYIISKFSYRPTSVCYKTARKISQYKKLEHSIDDFKSCLRMGLPFVFGFTVYESFKNDNVAKTGIMPIPKQGEKLLGGHAVMAVGFDNIRQVFIIRNSWGSEWGDSGYFYMPYEFIDDPEFANDFWTVIKD